MTRLSTSSGSIKDSVSRTALQASGDPYEQKKAGADALASEATTTAKPEEPVVKVQSAGASDAGSSSASGDNEDSSGARIVVILCVAAGVAAAVAFVMFLPGSGSRDEVRAAPSAGPYAPSAFSSLDLTGVRGG